MRGLQAALVALALAVISFAGQAAPAGQAAQRTAQSRDAVYRHCYLGTINKYGTQSYRQGYKTLNFRIAFSMIDRCVANGGWVD
jgi:hypothetical protein